MLLVFGITFAFICLLSVYFKSWKRKGSYWTERNVPYYDRSKVDSMPHENNFHDKERALFDGIKKSGNTQGYVGLIENGARILYIFDSNLVRSVLVQDFDSFVDRREIRTADGYFSKMIINSTGKFWRDLRYTLSSAFTTGRIRRMFPVFSTSSQRLKVLLEKELGQRDELDLGNALSEYAKEVILFTAFGLDAQSLSGRDAVIKKHITSLQNPVLGLRGWKLLTAVMFPKFAKLLGILIPGEEAIAFFRQLIQETIKDRDVNGLRRDDVLQLLMDARAGDAGSKLSLTKPEISKLEFDEELIVAQSLNFFLGGVESVQTMLSLIAYELTLNPEIQENVYQELKTITRTNGVLDYDGVMKLDYLEMVIMETLRKWPSGVRLERRSTKKYRIPNSNVVLEEGTMIVIPIYGIHRCEENYPSPDAFDPERFSPESKAKMDPYTFIPFGAGPRACIAIRFVYTEIKTAIGHLILNFKLEATQKTEVPLKFKSIGLFKPENGIWVRLVPRCKENGD